MSTEDTIAKLVKIAVKHDTLLNALAKGIADLVEAVWPTIAKCEVDSCVEAQTVKLHGKKICDRHCAEMINDLSIDDSEWEPLNNAESVRRVSDYRKIIFGEEESKVRHL